MREQTTPLLDVLRACTVPEQHTLADLAQTTRNYLYQLACGERTPNVHLAVRIENASIEMHVRTRGRIPKVRVRDLVLP